MQYNYLYLLSSSAWSVWVEIPFTNFLNSRVETYPDYKQSPESYIEFMETLLKESTAYGIRYDKK